MIDVFFKIISLISMTVLLKQKAVDIKKEYIDGMIIPAAKFTVYIIAASIAVFIVVQLISSIEQEARNAV
ncbi:MAG: hypothetical protein AMS21_00835 [Gemmatimonas sp. SG8_38_2]|nr:MAG: hypothetical protein AMS21_00835 [Gemmatimonas sp. SG8_38_2]